MGRKVWVFLESSNLEKAIENFMAQKTSRYQYNLNVEKEITKESKLYKKIALDLIFKSPQLQQLDYKASRILGELFKIFFENYVSKEIKPLFLLGADAEALLNEANKDDQKSRIISDIISEMTDKISDEFKKILLSKIPSGDLGTGEDVSNCVAFLASDLANYITGETIHVNGGMYMA